MHEASNSPYKHLRVIVNGIAGLVGGHGHAQRLSRRLVGYGEIDPEGAGDGGNSGRVRGAVARGVDGVGDGGARVVGQAKEIVDRLRLRC